MSVRAILLTLLVTAGVARTQPVLDPGQIQKLIPILQPARGERALACDVSVIKPSLNYSFRFQAGYSVSVPMSLYEGSGHALAILLSVTPDGGGKPVYLGNHMLLPAIPKTKNDLNFTGAYLLGIGSYTVNWVMTDDSERVCRKTWRVDVKLAHSERDVQLTIPAGMVTDLSARGLRRYRPPVDDSRPLRLTVLMHAAPMSPRRTHMRSSDTMTLVSSLSSLLEHVPTVSVRLVVFNLDQQKELYRKEGFTLRSMNQVFSTINEMQLSLVDVQVLGNRRGYVDMISDMVNQEIRSQPPSDAVVFLGPTARLEDKIPRESLEAVAGEAPRFFYFQVRPFFGGGRGGPVPPAVNGYLPDSINSAMSRLNGKVIVIHSPGDLAKAITRLEHLN